MSYTGQNPRFRSTILTDVGLASIGNPASGSHRIINRGGTLQVQDSTGLETAIGAGGTVDRITQTSHGFVVGEILYNTGSAYAKANANTSATAEALGMVSRVIDANTFELTLEGKVTGLTGLTAGAVYFLSATTAGAITVTEPSTLGYVSLPIGVAISTTAFYVKSSRGAVVGSTNARTEIALANNTTTNVQSVSAYQAGELTGWVEIDGTTDLKFYVAAPFAKNGAATDYNISPQYVGDTPPVGFSITVTSGGLIQATLPSITGYVSAKINFTLNAPAVGATFPLSIDSTAVQFSTLKAKDSGGFVFQNSSATQNGSFSDLGAVTFGHATLTTTPHILQGKPSSNAILRLQGSPSGSGTYQVWENLTFGALAMGFDDGSNIFKFRANSVSSTVLGELTSAGAWTFGPTSGTANHKVQSGAATEFQIASGAGLNTYLRFLPTGAGRARIFSSNTNGLAFANSSDTTIGEFSDGGGWTFGNSTANVNHVFLVNSTSSFATFRNHNTSTGSDGTGIAISKGSTTTTSSQIFVSFLVNDTTQGSGQITANGASQAAFGTFSDIRLKENIQDLYGELHKILSLRPVEFDYIAGGHQIGFIAQEIQEVYPDAVAENPQDGMLVLTGWDKTTARLVKAIQELSAKVTALENKGI